ncbi:MAG: hypothetical protein LBP55_08625 [Candidatus Adiutrix sp.]|jgi:hypothetical protein|nr:hypothetical protein [Candidatus Adiutrix sp.]
MRQHFPKIAAAALAALAALAVSGHPAVAGLVADLEQKSATLSKMAIENQTLAKTVEPGLGLSLSGAGLSYAGPGGLTLDHLSLKNNRAEISFSGDQALDSSASGGGGRLAGLASVTWAGGQVSGNSVMVNRGSHSHGGGLLIDRVAEASLYGGLVFSANRAVVNGFGQPDNPGAHDAQASAARGGALAVYNQGRPAEGQKPFQPSEAMKISLSQVTFSANSVLASGAPAQTVSSECLGGAVAVIGHVEASFKSAESGSKMFVNNQAIAEADSAGSAQGGAVALIPNTALAQSGERGPTAIFTNVIFENNRVEARGAANPFKRDIRGGALFDQAGFKGPDGQWQGRTTITGGAFLHNQAVSTRGAGDGGRARGGAIYSPKGLSLEGTLFQGNRAQAAQRPADGGALVLSGQNSLSKVSFEGNSVQSGPKNGLGQGGAISTQGQVELTITGSRFAGNTAAGARAEGGAIYLGRGGRLRLVDTSFTDNGLQGQSAEGGAVFVGPSGQVTIEVSPGQVVNFSGNRAGAPGETEALFFAAPPEPAKDAPAIPPGAEKKPDTLSELAVKVAQGGHLKMDDAVRGTEFKVVKDGPGLWSLARVRAAGGDWLINEGLVNLTRSKGRRADWDVGAGRIIFGPQAALVLDFSAGQPAPRLQAAELIMEPGSQIIVLQPKQPPKPTKQPKGQAAAPENLLLELGSTGAGRIEATLALTDSLEGGQMAAGEWQVQGGGWLALSLKK